MPTKGEENLKLTVEACQRVALGLDGVTAEGASTWKSALEEVAQKLQGLENKFFLKTNPSIPSTNACKKEIILMEELQQKQDWTAFGEALSRFRQHVDTLVKKAEMPGTILT